MSVLCTSEMGILLLANRTVLSKQRTTKVVKLLCYRMAGKRYYERLILDQAKKRLQDVATIFLGHKLRLSYAHSVCLRLELV